MLIKIADIEVKEAFNSRLSTESEDETRIGQSIATLARDIGREGQLTPVLVEARGPGKYRLIAGFRRLAAMQSLSIADIEATVVECESEWDAYRVNLKENLARKDLTQFEVAVRCAWLAKHFVKLTGGRGKKGSELGDLSRELGLSKSYVSRLVSAQNDLIPQFLDAWRGEVGWFSLAKAGKWAKLNKEEQLAEYKVASGETPATPATSNGTTTTSATASVTREPGAKRPSLSTLTLVLQMVTGVESENQEFVDGVYNALSFAVGDIDHIPGVYEPQKAVAMTQEDKDRVKKQKRLAKMRAKQEQIEKELRGE